MNCFYCLQSSLKLACFQWEAVWPHCHFLYDLADKYDWLSDAMIGNMVAVSESTPDPLVLIWQHTLDSSIMAFLEPSLLRPVWFCRRSSLFFLSQMYWLHTGRAKWSIRFLYIKACCYRIGCVCWTIRGCTVRFPY